MKTVLAVALGGSIGALARYGVSGIAVLAFGTSFPIGTLIVNLTGSLLLGFFYGISEKALVSEYVRAFVSIGFIGAFTTFSTFACETVRLFREGEGRLSLVNVLITNILGIAFMVAGIYAAARVTERM